MASIFAMSADFGSSLDGWRLRHKPLVLGAEHLPLPREQEKKRPASGAEAPALPGSVQAPSSTDNLISAVRAQNDRGQLLRLIATNRSD